MTGRIDGRAQLIEGDKLYFSKRNTIFALEGGRTWKVAQLAELPWHLSIMPFRLVSRLLRNEITLLKRLDADNFAAVAKSGIYIGTESDSAWRPVHRFSRGSRPLGLCTENPGVILYGEYGNLSRNLPVHVFASFDNGRTFAPVHSFAPGEVTHVHNVVWDSAEGCYWVLVGDSDMESGIARLSADFRQFDWLIRGSQMARAVNVMIDGDYLIYGTDSERAPNFIVRVHKLTGELTQLSPIPGSSLFCQRSLSTFYISTAVEPSAVNKSKRSMMFASGDGVTWGRVADEAKDMWHPTYFQFGTLVLPVMTDARMFAYSGQAVRGIDGATVIVPEKLYA